jgi:sporadic carbohydrate cluster 2OG-Fe(II) oxygenase
MQKLIFKEEIEKRGFVVDPSDSKEALEKLRNFLEKTATEELQSVNSFDGSIDLNNIHHFVKAEQINAIRIKMFRRINEENWRELVWQAAGRRIMEMLGPDILIQPKLNLSIVMPGDKASGLDAHSDSWSGDSPFQLNVWIPITDADVENSMYVLPEEKSLEIFEIIQKKAEIPSKSSCYEKSECVEAKFGEIVYFNPLLIHGSIPNTSVRTRVSLNVRFKSMFSPDFGADVPDRSVGIYYEKFKIGSLAKTGFKYLKIIKSLN